jgi:hypothetical protein
MTGPVVRTHGHWPGQPLPTAENLATLSSTPFLKKTKSLSFSHIPQKMRCGVRGRESRGRRWRFSLCLLFPLLLPIMVGVQNRHAELKESRRIIFSWNFVLCIGVDKLETSVAKRGRPKGRPAGQAVSPKKLYFSGVKYYYIMGSFQKNN